MRILFTSLLLLLIYPGASPQAGFDLNDCLEYAFVHNSDIKQYTNNIDKARIKVLQSDLNLLPSVNVRYDHYISSGRSLNMESYSWENEDIHQGNVALSADLILFKGLNNLYYRKSALISKDISKLEILHKKLLLGLEITTLFHKVSLTNSAITILELTNSGTKRELEKLGEQILAGTMPKSNIYELKAQEKKEEIEILALYKAKEKQIISLSNLINWQEGSVLLLNTKPISGVTDTTFTNATDNTYSMIVENSVITAIAEKDIELANNAIKLQKSYLYPTLSINASLSSRYLKNALNPVDAEMNYAYFKQIDNNQYKQLALTLSIPIFNRYQKTSEIKMLQIDLKNEVLEQEKANLQLLVELQGIQTDIDFLEKKTDEVVEMAEAYKKSYETAVEKYHSGLLDSYTLNASKNNYTSSLLQLNKLRVELSMNIELLALYARYTVE